MQEKKRRSSKKILLLTATGSDKRVFRIKRWKWNFVATTCRYYCKKGGVWSRDTPLAPSAAWASSWKKFCKICASQKQGTLREKHKPGAVHRRSALRNRRQNNKIPELRDTTPRPLSGCLHPPSSHSNRCRQRARGTAAAANQSERCKKCTTMKWVLMLCYCSLIDFPKNNQRITEQQPWISTHLKAVSSHGSYRTE